jgi:pimeloyl-ACP methyl ester carboxylesterase
MTLTRPWDPATPRGHMRCRSGRMRMRKPSVPAWRSDSRRSPWPERLALVGVAALIAATVVRNRTAKAERANPPTGSFVEVDGVRLHWVERGEGEPLVLLHGMSTMALDFMLSPLVPMAASKYRVIVFDRPGYGHSTRPRDGRDWGPEEHARLIHAALRKMGIERPVVLGHSWASQVAVAMALQCPDRVRSIVLEAGYYYPSLRPDILLTAPPAIPVIGDLLRYTFAPLLYRLTWPSLVKRMFAPAKVTPNFWRFPAWMTVRPSQLRTTAAESALVVQGAARLNARYRDLTVPAVIIAGSGDVLVPPHGHSVRLHHELPEADFRLVPDMGHMLHHLVPGEVMAAIDAAAALADRRSAVTARPRPRIRPAPSSASWPLA